MLRIRVRDKVRYDRAIPAPLSHIEAPAQSPYSPRLVVLDQAKGRWRINGTTYQADATPIVVKRDTAEIWDIRNVAPTMPHPMHIHGFQFRVLERRGTPAQVRALGADRNGLLPQDRGLVDTVLAWPGESVRIALDFMHPFSGDQTYMFHCHNLEHEDLGMMVQYGVKA